MNNLFSKYFAYRGASTLSKLEFTALNVLTLGIYSVYWGWVVWETVRLEEKKVYKIKSSIRAVLLPISALWLFPEISRISKKKFQPLALAFAYLLLVCSAYWVPVDWWFGMKGLGVYASLAAIETVILIPVVEAHRKAASKAGSPGKNNVVLISILIAIFILSIVDLFFATMP